eukprot:snap_masked-scaffold_2-processed-gene-17.38-mRNA-1 protein AED:1.00 eAED:1.00 QI:0/-1/0/0/-1/1/1/0/72
MTQFISELSLHRVSISMVPRLDEPTQYSSMSTLTEHHWSYSVRTLSTSKTYAQTSVPADFPSRTWTKNGWIN